MSEPPKTSSEESTGIPIQMTIVGILRNNQERENEAETPVIQTVLPEAMLIACANTSPDIHSQPARPHLLVCEIPADKNRSVTPSKLPKSDESKGKSKSVSYSTQLSFESEDEYYDPLFSVPSVFQSIQSPLKDAFSKSGAEKAAETQAVKDAKVVQCLNVENIGCDNLEISQVIPYEDGSHVLLVMIKKKENCDHEVCAIDYHCPDHLSKTAEDNAGNTSTSLDNTTDDKGSDSAFPSSIVGDDSVPSKKDSNGGASANGTLKDTNESNDDKESYTDLKPDSQPFNEETNSDNNTKYPVETDEEVGTSDSAGSSECVAEELKSSDNTKYPEETSDSAGPSVSAGADAMSNVDLLKCRSSEESNTSDTIKGPGTNTESLGTSPKSGSEQMKSQVTIPGSSHVLNVEDSVDKNSSSSEPKVSSTDNTSCSVFERNYSVCLLLYKTRKEKGRTLIEDNPCKTLFTTSAQDSLRDVFLLPDDAEDSFMPNSVEINNTKNVYLAGMFVQWFSVCVFGLFVCLFV